MTNMRLKAEAKQRWAMKATDRDAGGDSAGAVTIICEMNIENKNPRHCLSGETASLSGILMFSVNEYL